MKENLKHMGKNWKGIKTYLEPKRIRDNPTTGRKLRMIGSG